MRVLIPTFTDELSMGEKDVLWAEIDVDSKVVDTLEKIYALLDRSLELGLLLSKFKVGVSHIADNFRFFGDADILPRDKLSYTEVELYNEIHNLDDICFYVTQYGLYLRTNNLETFHPILSEVPITRLDVAEFKLRIKE